MFRTGNRILAAALLAVLTIATPSVAQNDESDEQRVWNAPKFADGKTEWRNLAADSFRLLVLQHMARLTQAKTRDELGGPFFKDYHRSVRIPKTWGDGDGWGINYVGHPVQGAASGFLWVANDPRSRQEQFGFNRGYWKTRWRALAFSTGYSLQFELGPLSEASIGNVGLNPATIGWTDHVTTPLGGTALLVAEDAVDRFLIQWVERRTRQPFVRALSRMVLNPSRSLANVAQGASPWHRDGRSMRGSIDRQ